MLKDRQKRLKDFMKTDGSECLLLFPGVDLFYSTGLETHASERLTVAIIPTETDPIIICPSFEKTRLERGLGTGSIRTWEENENPFELLGKILQELDVDQKQISLDNKLWFEWFLKIREQIPKATFVDAKAIVQASRLIKSEGEISLLREAAKIAAHSIRDTIAEVEVGMTELEIAKIVDEKLSKASGTTAFAIVQSGPNTAVPHAGPSERKIEKNDSVVIMNSS